MVNVDAAFDTDTGSGSTRVIIRDERGQSVAAGQRFFPHVIDAPMVEAYAPKEGLMLAQHIGCNQFIIQTDCILVVETMNDVGFLATPATTIYDVCIILWSGFSSISIEHCNREANRVAHELARKAFSSKSSWVDEPPSFILILNALLNDVIILSDQ
jgi:ribonuclease HI